MSGILYAGAKIGIIEKAIVVLSNKNGRCTVMGVAASGDNRCNFEFQYDWPEVMESMTEWLEEITDTLARDLDIAPSQMDIRERELLGLMREKWEESRGMQVDKTNTGLYLQ